MIKKILIVVLILIVLAAGVLVAVTLTNELYGFTKKLENNVGYRFSMVYKQGEDAPIYADCSYRAADDAYAFRFALQPGFQLLTYRMAFFGGNRYRIAEPSGVVSVGLYSKNASEVNAEDNVVYQIVSVLRGAKWLTGFLIATKTDLNGASANRYEVNADGSRYVLWFQNGLPARVEVDSTEMGQVCIDISGFKEEPDENLFKDPERGLYLLSDVTFDFFFGLFKQ